MGTSVLRDQQYVCCRPLKLKCAHGRERIVDEERPGSMLFRQLMRQATIKAAVVSVIFSVTSV